MIVPGPKDSFRARIVRRRGPGTPARKRLSRPSRHSSGACGAPRPHRLRAVRDPERGW
jgi:hypothetical protein